MNCCVVPNAILAFELLEVIAIDTKVALVTVNAVVLEMPPNVAVIVLTPGLAGVADPLVLGALLIVATAGSEEFQVTADVRFCVELSV